MQTRIVILSGHSLFAEGVASRLQQYLQQVELAIVDSRRPDLMAQITAAQPSILILDITDAESMRVCSLSQLLHLLPTLKIIRLDPQEDQIQVVSSEQRPVAKVRDLAEFIEQYT